jgi:hypothetical protein
MISILRYRGYYMTSILRYNIISIYTLHIAHHIDKVGLALRLGLSYPLRYLLPYHDSLSRDIY